MGDPEGTSWRKGKKGQNQFTGNTWLLGKQGPDKKEKNDEGTLQ